MKLSRLLICWAFSVSTMLISNSAMAGASGIEELLIIVMNNAERAKKDTLETSSASRSAVEDAKAARLMQSQLESNAKTFEQLISDLKKMQLELEKNCE